jgi:hypothetical protein
MQVIDTKQISCGDDSDLVANMAPVAAIEEGDAALEAVDAASGADEQSSPIGGVPRPDDVPEKFWDPEAGTLRTDALLRSYLELERRLGRSIPKPDGQDDIEGINRLLAVLGRPEAPDGYELSAPHPLVEPDAELNAILHDAGFTQRQAQLVYELAAERLVPLLEEAAAELAATRQIDRLHQHFGGPEAWRKTSAQIKAYAEANLPKETQDALSGSFEGVLALYEMMRKAEPDIVGQAGSSQLAVTEDSLRELIRDPRYWRDRDPEIVQRVTAGYRNLYPG